jgi:AcrR family transcriptional regulator
MPKPKSKLENSRQTGKHQVDEQRMCILDAAEKLFLQNGLENTKMVDIASAAGITKITLYRYFSNRDVIALEIHKRMILKIGASIEWETLGVSLEMARQLTRAMISGYAELRDAYRYMGMFDRFYLDNSADSALPRWTMDQLRHPMIVQIATSQEASNEPQYNRVIMIVSTVIWFLEKLALRGELTWSDASVPLEENLKLFEEMILGYIDRQLNTP